MKQASKKPEKALKTKSPKATRTERDTMGELEVPAVAYYGVQTARAIENFPISGHRLPRPMIRALGLIKQAAAHVNEELGFLEPKLAKVIKDAAQEVIDGKLDGEFPVDIFQTGSGTSSNMNVNEVIANRAAELLGGRAGQQGRPPERPCEHGPVQQ